MHLDRYVADLRTQLAAAAGTGDAEASAVAERLSVALEAAGRLVLLEALSDAASEITRAMAPGSVDIRLRGRDPEFVVTHAAAPEFTDDTTVRSKVPGSPSPSPAEPVDDTVSARTTLRLPDQLKVRVDRAAAEDGLSVNAWLVRAIAADLEPKNRRAAQREARKGDSFTGWAR